MRCIFILFLLFINGGAIASENLMEILSGQNATITDGVVRQTTADTMDYMRWKIQVFYNNTKHLNYNGTGSYEPVLHFVDDNIGLISYKFTTPSDLDDILYWRFGLNGSVRDTLVLFNIKDVMPNTTYTLQWRMLNNTQGDVAWTDMFLTLCGDGYSLALGDENCSRTCENQSVDGGYIPPNTTKVYEPENCTYDQSKIVCDNGWANIDNTCRQMCTAGITHLHIGETVNGLYASRPGTPALCVKYNGSICYGHLISGGGAGLNVNLDGQIYHLID